MWSATTLAPSFSALEADVAAQLAPVRGIERSQLRTDWHRYAVSRADAGGRRPQLVESRCSRRLSKAIRVNIARDVERRVGKGEQVCLGSVPH